ncbi:MAG: radical SAM protein [Candidatus Hecatellaceae archaeon]
MNSSEKHSKQAEYSLKFAHVTRFHPCYDPLAHFRFARIHLPVAAKCNIQCNYCKRSLNKVESRPGVASCLLPVGKAVEWVRQAVKRHPELRVVGIAGPGEPLANPETFEVLEAVHREHPHLIKCLSTNGLLLADSLPKLLNCGVKAVTVTINAVKPSTAAKIYEYVLYEGRKLTGEEAASLLLSKQFEGVKAAAEAGLAVKINTVLIPEINLTEVVEVAKAAKRLGAHKMNLIPLIPMYKFSKLRPPTCQELREAREKCEKFIPQFRLCKACRADAFGIPGLERPSYRLLRDVH